MLLPDRSDADTKRRDRRNVVVGLLVAVAAAALVFFGLLPAESSQQAKHSDAGRIGRGLLKLAEHEHATLGTCQASVEQAQATPDPWGTPFIVECLPSPIVRCAGPDNQFHTEDDKQW